METFYIVVATLLMINVLVGLIKVIRSPLPADRMLSAQLFGTSGVAVLLLVAQGMASGPVRDVALVLAVLAVIAVIAFVRRVWQPLAAE